MPSNNISPARSQGANLTPRKLRSRRTLSVGSPARSNVSERLTSIIDDARKNRGSFVLSPLSNRKSILTDNTYIDKPRRASWWKKLGDNSRDVTDVLNTNEAVDPNNIIEVYVDVLSQEKKHYTLDLPESSDNESINSIVVPQRRLFTQQSTQNKNNYDKIIGSRDTLAKINKTNNDLHDKSVKVTTKNLFNQAPKRARPAFPEALLTISPNKTVANKTKEMVSADMKGQVKTLFGNRPGTKRKNMFVDFVVSESEDEIPEIQPRVFGFPKKPDVSRRPSSASRGTRDPSPTSSINTDIEMDDWKLLPSSTMVDNQIEEMLTATTPVKKPRLSKLSEDKESENVTNVTANKTKLTNKSLISNNSKNVLKTSATEVNKVAIATNRKQPPCILESSTIVENDIDDIFVDTEPVPKVRPSRLSEKEEVDTSKTAIANKTKVINKSLTSQNKLHLSLVQNNTVTKINKSSSVAQISEGKISHEGSKILKQNLEVEQYQTIESNENKVEVKTEQSKSKTKDIVPHLSQIEKSLLTVNAEDLKEPKQIILQEDPNILVVSENSKAFEIEMDQDSEEDTKLEFEDNEEPASRNDPHISAENSDQDGKVKLVGKNDALENIEKPHNHTKHNDTITKDVKIAKDISKIDRSAELHKNEGKYTIADQHVDEHSLAAEKGQQQINPSLNDTVEQNIVTNTARQDKLIDDKNKQLEDEVSIAGDTELIKDDHSINKNEQNESNQNNEESNQNIEEEIEQSEHEKTIIEEGDQSEHEQSIEEGDERTKLEQSIEEEHEQSEHEQSIEEEDVQSEHGQSIEEEHQQSEHEQSVEEENEQIEDVHNKIEQVDERSKREQSTEEEDEQSEHEQTIAEENEQSEDEQNIEEVNEGAEDEQSIEEENEQDEEVEQDSTINELEEPEESSAEEEEEVNATGENDASMEQIDEDQEPSAHESDDGNESDNDQDEQNNTGYNEHDDGEDESSSKQVTANEEDTPSLEQNEMSAANTSHDTTGRHRNKKDFAKSPEAILQNMSNKDHSFTMKGRNTSIRKTKSMIKQLSIKPSLAPVRDSTGFSDGTKNSSAEGSGWDSHRTTRKTIRQTMGKDFSPRKSLRALVMEKSAKRYTVMSELNDEQIRVPQANSTQYPEPMVINEDEENDSSDAAISDHEVSKRTRQATLEMYLQSVKRKNQQQRIQIEQEVKNSLKNPSNENVNFFKLPSKSNFSLKRKANPKGQQSKPKSKAIKSTIIPLEDLPANLLEDMKYKPPKRYKPSNASWITKRLYNFIESKLEPKYDYKARIRAEKLVETIYTFTKDLRRHQVAPKEATALLKQEMARLNIVKTHFEFYNFFHDYMPREVRIKVVPDLVNKISLPKHGVFVDILREHDQ